MKKNNFDFTIPQRQSWVAILMLIWKTYRVLVRQIFPFLIILFVGNSAKSNYSTYIISFIGAVAVIGTINSILAFFRYYFHINDDKLIVEKGLISRSKTIIPFERIQTINFEQNLAHQVFSVVRLKVDTAGSAQKEFEFDAIGSDQAQALRDIILEKKSELTPKADFENFEKIDTFKESSYRSILKLSISDLLKVGVTENHIRSGGFIIFAIWVEFQLYLQRVLL